MSRNNFDRALAAINAIPDRRQREIVMREFYQAYKGDPRLWNDEAEAVEPRRLDSVLSVRMDADQIAAVRRRAEAVGKSASDLLRLAAEKLTRPVGFRCEHMSIGGEWLTSASCGSGCDMQPIYVIA